MVCALGAVGLTDNTVRRVLTGLMAGEWSYEKKGQENDEEKLFQNPSTTHPMSGLDPLVVPFQEKLTDGFFHAPCRIIPALEKKIFNVTRIIGFENEYNKRPWKDILRSEQSQTSIETLLQELRDLLIAYYKFSHQNSGLIFGLSGTIDYLAATKVCICDHIAMAHHHIYRGIHDAIDAPNKETQTITLTQDQRQVLNLIYASCKMTTLNAHRFENGWYTRVSYEPTSEDEKRVNALLAIDPHKPGEVVCTYGRAPDSIIEFSNASKKEQRQ